MRRSRVQNVRPTLISRIALATLGLALASPASLHAVDGILEINQARVDASGGFPYVISQLGNYRLTSNLFVPDPNTTAIQVAASNVTIDLNGFVISGVTACSGLPVSGCTMTGAGRGIDAEAVGGVRVRNGIVRGMGDIGISLGFAARVEDVRVVSNGTVGILVGGSSRVFGASVIRNGGSGVQVGLDSSVSDSVIVGNGQAGIECEARTAIIGNVVASNGQAGMPGESGIVASGSDNTIVHNVAATNGFAGIAASQDNVVTENAVLFNGDFGMRVGEGSTIAGNAVRRNSAGGILGRAGSTLLGNAIDLNAGPGVSLDGTRTGLSDNVITDNSGGTVTPPGSFLEIGGNVCGTNLTCP